MAHWGVSLVLADERDSLTSLGDRMIKIPEGDLPPFHHPIRSEIAEPPSETVLVLSSAFTRRSPAALALLSSG